MNKLQLCMIAIITFIAVHVANVELLAQDQQQNQLLVNNNRTGNTLQWDQDQVSLADLLSRLEKKFSATFLYDHKTVANKFVSRSKASLSENPGPDLSRILQELGLTYDEIHEGIFLLMPRQVHLDMASLMQTISGTVTDAQSGETLPGVNVIVKGTTTGTSTDSNGTFELAVESLQDTLIFSFVGYQTQQVPINGRTEIDITMIPQTLSGQELVVTALGLEREARSVGYSVQEVQGEDLQKAITPNVGESLIGKVSGLTITTSNDFFTDPQIYLRGKEPLIVVNGIPRPNTNMYNISSEDIEEISVLKSAAASALYGSLGVNGAIQITLTSGKNLKQGTSVSINTSNTFQTGYLRIPNIQSEYGPGNAGRYSFGTGAAGGGGINDFDYAIWGPKFNGQLIKQFDSPIDPETGERQPTPWVARSDNNLAKVLETGIVSSNNITVQRAGDVGSVTLSNTYKYNKGMIPGAQLDMYTTRLRGTLNLSDKLTVDGSLQFNLQNADNLPRSNYGPNSLLYNLTIWGGSHFDISNEKFQNFWEAGEEGVDQYWVENWRFNNPYVYKYGWKKPYKKNDYNGYVKVNYQFTDKIDAFVRVSVGTYNLTREEQIGKDIYDYSIPDREGRYRYNEYEQLDLNTDFLINYRDSFFEGNMGVKASIGGNQRYYDYGSLSASTTQLVIPGIFKLSNSVDKVTPSTYKEKKGVYSAYTTVDLSYKDQIYLTLTGRADKSSSLPQQNDTYLYPSVSLSAVVSDMVQMPDFVSLLRLRAAYAKVGDDMAIYSAVNSYNTGDRYRNLPTASYPSVLDNPQLEASYNTSYEYGIEANFFDNRIGVDVSYYRNTYGPQIFTQDFSSASGYSGITLNGRKTQRRGFGITFNTTPIKTTDFSWSTRVNFDNGKEYLVSLPPLPDGTPREAEGRTEIGDRLYDYWYNKWERSPDDQLIIEPDGLPKSTDQDRLIGNTQPDFTISLYNSFNYQNFSFSFLVDGRIGGITFDGYERDLWRSGSHPNAVHSEREQSNIAYRNGGDAKTMQIPGVKVVSGEVSYDPEGNIISDTRVFEPSDYLVDYQQWAIGYKGAWESNVIEKTFAKLREVTLSYNIPNSVLNKTIISDASISLVGRNLLYWTKDDTYGDLETYTMSTGDTTLQLPATRTVGFNLNIKL